MLARIEMKLGCQENLSYYMSSLFHGVLMERLSEGMGIIFMSLVFIPTPSIWSAGTGNGTGLSMP